MRITISFILINMMLTALLLLISCTAKSNNTELPLVASSTPSRFITPTSINPIVTYTPTPTSIPASIIQPLSTELKPVIPDGRVLFEGDSMKDGVQSHGIVLLDVELNKTTLLFEENQDVNGQIVSLDYPSITWSPDGHWFAFVGTDAESETSGNRYQDIYVARSDGTEIHRLTDSPQYQKFSISWSPNGQYILVAMGIGSSSLYLIDSSSGVVVKRLTASYYATWSPNGKQIAFKRYQGLGLLSVEDETSLALDIPDNLEVQSISWAPNDDQIVFTAESDSGCTDIFLINIKTGGFVNLTASNHYENSPVWLPDGRHLAFSRSTYSCTSDQGDWEIYTTNLSHEEYKLMSNVGYWTTLAWAPVPNLGIGQQYTITEAGAFLNLRTGHSLDEQILKKLPAGELIMVLEGPVDAEGYYWWKIRTQDGTEGWAVEQSNWFKPMNE